MMKLKNFWEGGTAHPHASPIVQGIRTIPTPIQSPRLFPLVALFNLRGPPRNHRRSQDFRYGVHTTSKCDDFCSHPQSSIYGLPF